MTVTLETRDFFIQRSMGETRKKKQTPGTLNPVNMHE